ncbi:MAG: YHS domain-containing protein [Bdellovibrionales bacterium]|nr:YHS domain-containing protein [Bdellovibrionales bacterium]
MNTLINMKVSFLITLVTVFASLPAVAQSNYGRNVAEYNLEGKLGLKGHDPVSVFPEGGGVTLEGSADIQGEYQGVVYYFSSDENREIFLANPDKYEPTYGGFCAYAMASGSRVDIQPQFFTISGNRAHYFVSSRAKRNFDREVADFENRADQFWKELSGEDPRL